MRHNRLLISRRRIVAGCSRTGAGSVVVAVVVAATVLTLAQPSHAHPPPFWNMPDLSGDTRVGVETVAAYGEVAGESTYVLDTGLIAEYAVSPKFVLAARLPFAYVYSAPDSSSEITSFALGNLALGLRRISDDGPRASPRWRYGLSGAVYLPTHSDDGEPGIAAVISRRFSAPDSGRYLDATTFRLDFDARIEGSTVFFQTEFGLAFRTRFDDSDNDLNARLGAGLGVMFGQHWAALGEFALDIDELDGGDDGDTVPVLDLGVRYHGPGIMTGLRLYLPLAGQPRDDSVIGVGLDLSARF